MSAKTTYQRTATGPVAISETCALGKFIQLENNPSSGVRKVMEVMSPCISLYTAVVVHSDTTIISTEFRHPQI